MKKRLCGMVLCFTMLTAMLAGCGQSAGESTSSVNGSKEKQTSEQSSAGDSGKKIVYWSMWESTEPQGMVIQEACEAYQKETGITVDVQFKGRTGQREGLQAALDSGTQIDMFDEDLDRVNGTWGKYLMDLEELVKEKGYEETANPVMMQFCRDTGDGILKSIPYQPYVFTFFYNKALFEQAGVTEEPKTWDEFLDVCEKLKEAGITPLTTDDAYADTLIGTHMARLAGEARVQEIVKNGEWDDPVVTQTVEDYAELASKGYFSENVGSNVWPSGQNSELALGEVAMYLNGSWLPNEVKNIAGEDFRWGCFAYPEVTKGMTDTGTDTSAVTCGSQVFGINKDSQMAEEVFDLICRITQGEYDKKLSVESNGIPSDVNNTEWPALIESVKPVLDSAKIRLTYGAGIEVNNDATPVIKENFIKVMAGGLDAQGFSDAMKSAVK